LDGRITALENVPDPVFAQRIVGDGVSIDPTSSTVLAPCDGEIVHAHSSGHALTLRSAEGVEILIHVGVDTVQLKGEGFSLKVRAGDKVSAGQALLEFDADLVARKAKSLLTQLLVTNVERIASLSHPSGSVKAGKDLALEIQLQSAAPAPARSSGGAHVCSDALIISNPTGLHARPSSVLAHEAKRFHSAIRLQRGEAFANAKSLVSIMSLNVKQGDKIVLTAEGADAQAAVDHLFRLVQKGLEEKAPAPQPVSAVPAAPARSEDPRVLSGVCASGGLALGKAHRFLREETEVPETAEDVSVERANLSRALESAKADLEALQDRFALQKDSSHAGIFGAHRELLDDPELLAIAEGALSKGASAAAAWRCAYKDFAGRLSRLNNDLLAARAVDVRDAGMRVLRILTGEPSEHREFPAGCILLAEDLTPSDTAGLDRDKVLGVCTVGGGSTSHVSILCRALGIPALAAVEPSVLALPEGAPLILDADKGMLLTQPTAEENCSALGRLEQLRARRKTELAASHEDACTQDGRRIRVEANIGSVEDAQEAAAIGAEGVGLCRTEFLFLEKDIAPSEDEQCGAYAAMSKAFSGGWVVIRVLDVGGDKSLAYLPMAKEDNPFLGERGIRLLLDRPEILRAQFRAVLRAVQGGARLKVLFPMIAGLGEFRAAKKMLEEEAQGMGVAVPPAGVMIEVPSAALLSEHLAREADFFSLGTNDLTQYTLAMDRGNPKLAARVDALDPAVLLMVQKTVEGAHLHGRSVGVCGGAAGDLQAVLLLIGLGVSELSVSASAVPAVKAAVRRADYAACRELALKALKASSSAEVRALVAKHEEAVEAA
jgi:phosphocarrier protein FPr